jgi:hypothetical protein
MAIPLPSGLGRRAFLSGTRGLLFVILSLALVFGWFGREYRRAEERTMLVAELARENASSRLNEPTLSGQLVRKFLPGRERRIRDKVGGGWFDRPTVFVLFHLTDAKVSGVAERLRKLGTVREVHYDGPDLTERGVEALRDGLPGVNVVPNASTDLHRYWLMRTRSETVAYEAMFFTIAVLIAFCLMAVALLRWFVRRLRGIRRIDALEIPKA